MYEKYSFLLMVKVFDDTMGMLNKLNCPWHETLELMRPSFLSSKSYELTSLSGLVLITKCMTKSSLN